MVPVLLFSLFLSAFAVIAILRLSVYRPDLMRSQVEAMLNGDAKTAHNSVKKDDKMVLWLKARRKERAMIPTEMGTVLIEKKCYLPYILRGVRK
jgi:hypothetical protein